MEEAILTTPFSSIVDPVLSLSPIPHTHAH